MNKIKELRTITGLSQSKFASYLGIPVANIQHWEQGVTNPPGYLLTLISRVMKNDGYPVDVAPTKKPAAVKAVGKAPAKKPAENKPAGKSTSKSPAPRKPAPADNPDPMQVWLL